MSVIIIPETCCEDIDCLLNCEGHCNQIGTLLLSLGINGLPAPESCSDAIYDFDILKD